MEEMSDEDWLKWTSENVPTVKYKDCCTGKIYEVNPKVNYLSHAVQKFLWKWLLIVVTITHL